MNLSGYVRRYVYTINEMGRVELVNLERLI